MIYTKFIRPKEYWESTEAEKVCKTPCRKMTNKVSLRAENLNTIGGKENFAYIYLNFKKTVRVEKKIVVYTLFNFIIDVGSSLGLWLGLSALSIVDLAFEFLKLAIKLVK